MTKTNFNCFLKGNMERISFWSMDKDEAVKIMRKVNVSGKILLLKIVVNW